MLSRHVGLFSPQPIEKQCVTTINASISPNIIAERRDTSMKGEILGSSIPDKNNMRVAPGELAFAQKHASFHESTKRGNKILNAFTSFTGISYSKGTTQERFEDEFCLLGVASQAVLFEDDSNSNTGFPIQTSGSCTITNNSKSTLMPGQFVTWERPLKDVSTSSQDRADRVVASKHVGQLAPLFITDITDVFPDHARIAAKGTRNKVSSKSSTTSQSDLIATAHKRQIMKAAFDGVILALEYGLVKTVTPQMNSTNTPQYLKKQGGIGALFSSQHFIGAKLEAVTKTFMLKMLAVTKTIIYGENGTDEQNKLIRNRVALVTPNESSKLKENMLEIAPRWIANIVSIREITDMTNEDFYQLHTEFFDNEGENARYASYLPSYPAILEYMILAGTFYFRNTENPDSNLIPILNSLIKKYYRSCNYFLRHQLLRSKNDTIQNIIDGISLQDSKVFLENDEYARLRLPIAFYVIRALFRFYSVAPTEKVDRITKFFLNLYATIKLCPAVDMLNPSRSTLFASSIEFIKKEIPEYKTLTFTDYVTNTIINADTLGNIESYVAPNADILSQPVSDTYTLESIGEILEADNAKFEETYSELRSAIEKSNRDKDEALQQAQQNQLKTYVQEADAMLRVIAGDEELSKLQWIFDKDRDEVVHILELSYNMNIVDLTEEDFSNLVNVFNEIQRKILLLFVAQREYYNFIITTIGRDEIDTPTKLLTIEKAYNILQESTNKLKGELKTLIDNGKNITTKDIRILPYELNIFDGIDILSDETIGFLRSGKPKITTSFTIPLSSLPFSSSSPSTIVAISGTQEQYMELSRIFGLLERTDSTQMGEYSGMTREINARALYGYLSDKDRKKYSGINPSLFDSSKFDLPIDSLGRPKLEYVSPSVQLKQLYNSQDGSVVAYLFAEDMNRMFQRSFAMVTKTSPPSFPVNVTIR